MEWIDAAAEKDIGEGQSVCVAAGALILAVVRSEGRLYAIEDVCTHDGEALTGGPIEDGEIICPRHGARFCLRTGEALCPPAYEPVRTFETKIESGRVWVRAG
jgi:3-phenylpropionate/trans-cinnamate dioxygenase ferredoxin component